MTPPLWNDGKPAEPGLYIGFSAHPERKAERPSLYGWDGKTWQHWTGFYDHAVTHWMPCDLPTRKEGK